jgi:DNA-binding NarL/FixJ family response regulator
VQPLIKPREQKILDLLLLGYENVDIGKELGMKIRTVKAHLSRLYARFGIVDGVKRVKLAVLIHRRLKCETSTETGTSPSESGASSPSSLKVSTTA